MIDDYGFNIELLAQTPTHMTCSTECHEGYVYRHIGIKPTKAKGRNITFGTPCDPLFSNAWKMCRDSLDILHKYASDEVEKEWGVSKKRVTRSAARANNEEKTKSG